MKIINFKFKAAVLQRKAQLCKSPLLLFPIYAKYFLGTFSRRWVLSTGTNSRHFNFYYFTLYEHASAHDCYKYGHGSKNWSDENSYLPTIRILFSFFFLKGAPKSAVLRNK
jgi:hypothetical protein